MYAPHFRDCFIFSFCFFSARKRIYKDSVKVLKRNLKTLKAEEENYTYTHAETFRTINSPCVCVKLIKANSDMGTTFATKNRYSFHFFNGNLKLQNIK